MSNRTAISRESSADGEATRTLSQVTVVTIQFLTSCQAEGLDFFLAVGQRLSSAPGHRASHNLATGFPDMEQARVSQRQCWQDRTRGLVVA